VTHTTTITSGSTATATVTATLTQWTTVTSTVSQVTANQTLAVIVGAVVVASASIIGGYELGRRRARKVLLRGTH
jgi:hypothetical protein